MSRAALDLIDRLRAANVRIWIAGDQLRYKAPAGTMTPDLLDEMRARKADLLEFLKAAGSGSDATAAIVPRPAGENTLPASVSQQRFWLLHQLDRQGGAYNVVQATRIRGPLDLQSLERALQSVVDRHEALRTSLELRQGELVQIVHDRVEIRLDVSELADAAESDRLARARAIVADEARDPFVLSTVPLCRARVVRLAPHDHVLVVVLHHSVADGRSVEILFEEMALGYGAAVQHRESAIAPLPIQYGDYTLFERRRLAEPRALEQIDWWKARLAGAPPVLTLPLDHPRPTTPSSEGGTAHLEIPPAATAALRRVGQESGASLYMTVVAALATLLGRYSGQDEICVGCPVENRPFPETSQLIGVFINTLVLRLSIAGNPSFRDLLRRVRDVAFDAYEHQDVPFDKLVEALQPDRTLASSPLYQVTVSWLDGRKGLLTLPGLETAPFGVDVQQVKLDLSLEVFDAGDSLHVVWFYSRALFDPETTSRMIGHFRRLIDALAATPDRGIADVPLLSEQERALIEADSAAAAPYPSETSAIALFEAQAAATPNAVAVVDGDRSATYVELDRWASAVAHRLTSAGAGPDRIVAVLVRPSIALIAAVLGVLKTGAAYLPLDADLPDDRRSFMIDDSQACAVLTREDVESLSAEADDGSRIDASIQPASAAYVIYTSGSTGRPKGVTVPHSALVNYLWWARKVYLRGERLDFPLFTSIAFDLTVTSVFLPLVTGGRIVVYRDDATDPAVLRVLRDQAVDVVKLTPSHLAMVADAKVVNRRIRRLIVGGEDLPTDLCRRIHHALGSTVEIYNEYGPTETTVGCMIHRFDPERDRGPSVPIGRPADNVRLHILGGRQHPVPIGVAGELCIAGDGVARGYVNRPELTAERFVPDPVVVGARMYRSGDLARRRADGVFEYIGRTDDQVKIRGYRIDPGEVAAALSTHEAVAAAVVRVVERGEAADRCLVAYYTRRRDASADELRAHLARRLPAVMVPAAFVPLDQFPLTAHGKIEWRALPVPGALDRREAAAFVAPRSPLEHEIAAAWAAVLHLDRVGVHDPFFAIGGHSLLATRLAAQLSRDLAVDLPPTIVFDKPTVAELAEDVLARRGASVSAAPGATAPIARTRRDRPIPLSSAQRRLWFLHQLDGGASTYSVSPVLRVRGDLDRAALEAALSEIVRRHEGLRTNFVATSDGGAEQRIAPAEQSTVRVVFERIEGRDAAAVDANARRRAVEEVRRPFDLERDLLLRVTLLQLRSDEHLLVLVVHHIVTDGWSAGILVREVAALYEAFAKGERSPLPELTIQYADFAAWEAATLTDNVVDRELEFWRDALRGAPAALDLPFDFPRPPALTHRGGATTFVVGADVLRRLRALTEQEDASLFMGLVAALDVLLRRYTGQDDLVVGAPFADRPHPDVQGLIGFFVNLLPIRVDLSGQPSFRDVLRRTRRSVAQTLAHQRVPFERLVDELKPDRDPSRMPVFQTVLAYQDVGKYSLELPGLSIDALDVDRGSSKFDLLFIVEGIDGEWRTTIEYSTDLFEAGTIARMAGHFSAVLDAVVADPNRSIDDLELLSAEERHTLVERWSGSRRDYPRDAAVSRIFESVAARDPGALALVMGDAVMTYGELNHRANGLARRLRAQGIVKGALVGLYAERSFELVVGLMGVLKAGAAYVPLDPSYPVPRLATMIADAGITLVLTHGAFPAALRVRAERVSIDGAPGEPGPNLAVAAEGHDVAYVMYTSGSTGAPKGSRIPHRAIARLVCGADYVSLGPAETILQLAPIAFDASTFEIWAALLNGGRLVLAPPEPPSLADIGALIRRHHVTTMWLTASLFHLMVDERLEDLAPLRQLLAGGEALSVSHVTRAARALWPGRVINGYGPTENTTFTCCYAVDPERVYRSSIPIGRPVANTKVYVLDASRRLVPVGVAGELYAGGDGLAIEYLHLPELTEMSFVPNPFGEGRLYRTGDRVRWLPDGTLEFLGRLDDQVKIRGFRVELGEVETQLVAQPDVREAVVVARAGSSGRRDLVAYVVPADAAAVDARFAERLKEALGASLPQYMVPRAIVVLERLPLSANGKVDRAALPAPDRTSLEAGDFAAPRTSTEIAVAKVFGDVLEIDRVGLSDGFFELGGHSLLATQLVSRLRRDLAVELPLRQVFETPDVARLARAIDALGAAPTDAAVPSIRRIGRSGPLALSFAQERLWFLQRLEPDNPFYNVAAALRLQGQLDVDALHQSLRDIVQRHEVLRTTYHQAEGRPFQRIHDDADLRLTRIDLSADDAREASVDRLAREEGSRPFDLEQGPVVRATLVRLGDRTHVLLFTVHHIASDGWSIGVLVNELTQCYLAKIGQRAGALPRLSIQYADYAAWQRSWMQGDVYARQLAHWTTVLAGYPPDLALRTDRPRPPQQTFQGGTLRFEVDASTTCRLQALSRESGSTIFMTLLAALGAVFAKYSGQEDLVIGSPIANRTSTDVEPLIGFFVNTLALRLDLAGNPSFRELVARARTVALDAYANQDLPFERLVDELQPERDLSRNPLFQVMFAVQNAPIQPIVVPGLEVTPLELSRTTALFDLVIDMWERGDGLSGVIEYNADLFDRDTVERLVAHFQVLLAEAAKSPDTALSALPLTSAAERRRIVEEFNANRAPFPIDRTLHELFEEQASAGPDRVAAEHRDRQIRYAALNANANRLAHRLRRIGVQPNDFVGLLLPRGFELLTAMLGVLKAGGAFVPIDPSYPDERVAYMIGNADPRVLLTTSELAERSAGSASLGVPIVELDREDVSSEDSANPRPVNGPADRAYMLYTSGSTGLPKGAIVRHNGKINHILGQCAWLDLDEGTAFLQTAPSSSDIAVWQFLGPLLVGGRTVIADYETVCDPAALWDTIRARAITIIELVPVALNALLDHVATRPEPERRAARLRWALATGEAVSPAVVNRWLGQFPHVPVVNAYGPTEAADDVCQFVVSAPLAAGTRSVAVGTPLANLSMYVLDRHLHLQPIGVPGEICVGGIGVGEGYWRDPVRTAESFVPNPHAGTPGERLYRTGDMGYWRPDGLLECVARIDDQTKIRGFRIELGDIETTLERHPAVQSAVVVARAGRGSVEKQLVGYILPDPDAPEVRAEVQRIRSEQVDLWQDLHQNSYRETLDYGDPTFNVIGWDSTYTGGPLDREDMREYVDRTVALTLRLRPGRLLEVGCGTGLLMFRLAPHLSAYTGIDLSAHAIDRLRQLQPAPNVHLRHGRADDLSEFEADSIDTVIFPSVLQYFPGVEYLVGVFDEVRRILHPDGAIVFGDVRSLPLLDAFHASVALVKADASLAAEDLDERILALSQQEQELALDPLFFYALARRSGVPCDVEVLPKRGARLNEMTRFRYDVVMRFGARARSRAPVAWQGWEDGRWTLEAIRQRLATDRDAGLYLRDVPNTRVAEAVALRRLIRRADRPGTAGEIRARVAGEPALGIEPEDLYRLGETLGYDVHVSVSSAGRGERLDVGFRSKAANAAPPAPPEAEGWGGWAAHANNPLQERLTRALAPRLREHLKARLPHYMVPSTVMVVDHFPTTPAGKIDRRALPAPARGPVQVDDASAPRTPVEGALASIWCDVLALEQCGIRQNFFDIGGHSLKATQVVSRIKQQLGVDVPLRTLFSHPTIEELATTIAATGTTPAVAQRIPRAPAVEFYPVSHAQRRLWVLAQLDAGAVAYNMPASIVLDGRLDRAALERAFGAIVARHASLRTTFAVVDGEPMQRVHDHLPVSVRFVDLSDAPEGEARARDEALRDAAHPFDLAAGPLVRVSLLRLALDRHVLLFNMHHIVSDDWSMGVLIRELMRVYDGASLAPLAIQYPDYAQWQRERLESAEAETHREYWRGRLAGDIPALDLPTDRPRPPIKTYRGGSVGLRLDAARLQALRQLARRSESSLFMTVLAAVKVLLYRYTGQTDLIVAAPVAGREHPDLESQIGFYVNMLPLRDTVIPEQPFVDLLGRVTRNTTDALAHQAYPFDRLVDDLALRRDPSRMPICDVVVVMLNTGVPDLVLPGLATGAFVVDYASSQYDLHFLFEERDDALRVVIVYNPDLFDADRIERMAGHLDTLLTSIVRHPERPVAHQAILTADERRQIEHFGRRRAPASVAGTLVERFDDHAARTPDREAVSFTPAGDTLGPRRALTYAELDEKANLVAAHLRQRGAGRGVFVGLYAERSMEAVVGLLGILKAGAAYVPIDTSYPVERVAFMIADAGVRLVVTEASLVDRLDRTGTELVLLDDIPAASAVTTHEGVHAAGPDDVAYVIYTSGSTGSPKGVMVTHRNATRLFDAAGTDFDFGPDDVWTLFHSIAFDFSVWEIWGALLYGGRLVVVPHWTSRSPDALLDLIEREGVTVLNQTPSAFGAVVDAEARAAAPRAPALRYVVFGGEALDPAALLPWAARHGLERPRLINMYGITETTVHVTCRPLRAADLEKRASVIGPPLSDLRIDILDPAGERVPIGVAGEIHVGGAGVAAGYWRRPQLTADRFVPDGLAGGRMYRSGDLARYLPDGDIEYLGRIDQQVKVRGFRIELGEIEAALVSHPAVRQALVVAAPNGGAPKLVAYVIGEDVAEAELRQCLRARLPDYMIPSAIVPVPVFPLTPHGKIDRAALPDPDRQRARTAPDRRPKTERETLVSDVLAGLIGIDEVGLHENFFDLGAHSLLLIQAHRALEERLARTIPLIGLYQHPTVSALAAFLTDGREGVAERPSIQDAASHGARRRERRRSRRQPT